MLDFDLRDTAEGQDILKDILIKAGEGIIEALKIRFEDVPQEIQEFVNSIIPIAIRNKVAERANHRCSTVAVLNGLACRW